MFHAYAASVPVPVPVPGARAQKALRSSPSTRTKTKELRLAFVSGPSARLRPGPEPQKTNRFPGRPPPPPLPVRPRLAPRSSTKHQIAVWPQFPSVCWASALRCRALCQLLLHARRRPAQTIVGARNSRPVVPLCTRPHSSPTPTTTASHDTSRPASALPARWSITNRLFGLRSLYASPPRPPASRLWNPVNSSPRTLQIQFPPPTASRDHEPNFLVQPTQDGARDEYPLLTLPEQRLSRQSPAPSSLVVERSTAANTSRTSIGLPRDRNSQLLGAPPPSPPPTMALLLHEPASPDAPHDDDAAAAAATLSSPRDIEAGATVTRPSPPRISLPSRPHSMHSHDHPDGGDDDTVSEFPWGPSHPCFPHPNPHVPLHSPLYASTRIVRIKRDWMLKGDLAPTFANLYPEILDPLVTEEEFRRVMQHINDTLIDAFDPYSFRAWVDSVMGVATFWLWEDAGFSGVKRKLEGLEKWLDEWNRSQGEKEGVRIVPLRRTGYLTVRNPPS